MFMTDDYEGYYVDFIKRFNNSVIKFASHVNASPDIASQNSNNLSNQNDRPIYFHRFQIAPIDCKIDYQPVAVDMQALHQGDYSQVIYFF